MPASTFLPTAGQVINVLIDTFDLRSFDTHGILKQRNSLRFLAGERVSEEAERLVFDRFAKTVLNAALWPDALSFASISPSPVIQRALASIKPAKLLSAWLSHLASSWNDLVITIERQKAPLQRVAPLAAAFVRLVTIDIACRLGAWLWLTPGSDDKALSEPIWAKPKGTSKWLRDVLTRCGDKPPSRDSIALELSVNLKTVDAWLDAGVRPTDANLVALMKFLSVNGAGAHKAILREARLTFSCAALTRLVGNLIGEKDAIGAAYRLWYFAHFFPAFVRHSKRPQAELAEAMTANLVAGTFPKAAPWIEFMLHPLRREEEDPRWKASLRAVTRSWQEHISQLVCQLQVHEQSLSQSSDDVLPELRDAVLDHVAGFQEMLVSEDDPMQYLKATAEHGEFAHFELTQRGVDAMNAHDFITALEIFKELVRLRPEEGVYHYYLGHTLSELSMMDEAILECELAVQLDPTFELARFEVGAVLLSFGRDEDARVRFEQLITSGPEPSSLMLVGLAFAREVTGDIPGAIEAYELAVQKNAKEAEAFDRLAHLYLVTGKARRGIECAKKAKHLGFSTVYLAQKSGYYKGGGHKPRPLHRMPGTFIRFNDSYADKWEALRTSRRSPI